MSYIKKVKCVRIIQVVNNKLRIRSLEKNLKDNPEVLLVKTVGVELILIVNKVRVEHM